MMKTVYALETGKMDETLNSANLSKVPMLLQSFVSLNGYGLVAARNGRVDDAAVPSIPSENGSLARTTGRKNRSTEIRATQCPRRTRQSTARPQKLWCNNCRRNCGLPMAGRSRLYNYSREPPHEEDALTFEFGPPIPVKPAHELYGEELQAAHRPKEARDEFQRALARAPKRVQSLRGDMK